MYAQWFGHNEVSKIRAPHGIGLFQVICSYPSSLSLDQLSGNEPKTFKPYFSVWPKATVRGFNVSVLIRKEHPKGSASANRSKFTGMKIKYGYASWNANNKSQTDGSFWCHPYPWLMNEWEHELCRLGGLGLSPINFAIWPGMVHGWCHWKWGQWSEGNICEASFTGDFVLNRVCLKCDIL